MRPEPFQPTLDFTQKLPPAAQEKIADGMAQADRNANEKWKHFYDGCVLAVATRLEELTSDDVLEEMLKLHGEVPKTHNLAAIGPAMKRAKEMGVIAPTERFLRSKRLEKNGNLHRVWKSNYYVPKKAE